MKPQGEYSAKRGVGDLSFGSNYRRRRMATPSISSMQAFNFFSLLPRRRGDFV